MAGLLPPCLCIIYKMSSLAEIIIRNNGFCSILENSSTGLLNCVCIIHRQTGETPTTMCFEDFVKTNLCSHGFTCQMQNICGNFMMNNLQTNVPVLKNTCAYRVLRKSAWSLTDYRDNCRNKFHREGVSCDSVKASMEFDSSKMCQVPELAFEHQGQEIIHGKTSVNDLKYQRKSWSSKGYLGKYWSTQRYFPQRKRVQSYYCLFTGNNLSSLLSK